MSNPKRIKQWSIIQFLLVKGSLSPLAKKYVLQLLYIDDPVTASSLLEWVLPDGVLKHRVAIDRLIQLRVFTEILDRKRETIYKLNPMFQMNLREHIVHGCDVTVWNRTKSKCDPLIDLGAKYVPNT